MPPRSFRRIAPGRLEVRQGGGGMAIFGLPFLGAGLFMMLICAGVVRLQGGESAPWFMMPALLFMGLAFTLVGGALVFGRSWTTLSSADRTVVMQVGLLVPMSTKTYRVDGYNGVILEFIRGDSDSSDQYPVSLKARDGQQSAAVQLDSVRRSARASHGHRRALSLRNRRFFDRPSGSPFRRAGGHVVSTSPAHRASARRDDRASRVDA